MKIVQLINQNIPIWSILCGDHALKECINLVDSRLLKQPNFLDPLENKLRFELFKSKRVWIQETMQNASFALVQFSLEELFTYNTCFTDVSFKKFSKKYQKSHTNKTGFLIKRPRHSSDLAKSKEDVKHLMVLATKMETSFVKETTVADVLNPQVKNEDNIFLAANRGFLMQTSNNIIIMDGTHRLTAYSLAKTKKSSLLPNNLYGFYWIKP